MRIERVEIFVGHVPVNLRFSYGSFSQMPFIIVAIHAGGHIGTGESGCRYTAQLETLASALAGKDANQLDKLFEPRRDAPTFAYEVFSMALHDLVARSRGIPLRALLGTVQRTIIPLRPCIFPPAPVPPGCRWLKIKLLGDLTHDLATIRAIREVMPDGDLLADVNSGYKTLAAAREFMRRADLTTVEDPLAGSLDDYATLRREFDRPRLMLDAPTRGWAGLRETCAKQAAHEINFHPNQQGAFTDLLERARLATAAGIIIAIGDSGCTGIAQYAFAQIASVIGTNRPCGYFIYDIPGCRPPIKDGHWHLDNSPGHGAELNLAALHPFIETTITKE